MQEHDADPLLAYPVVTEITVLWGDQDAFGHVNNVAYLRWCETARVEYLQRVVLFPDLPAKGVGPIVASLTCHYRRTLTFPDSVRVGTRVTRIGNSSFDMEHRVVSRATGALAAEVSSTLVALDYATGKPVRVPEEIREAIARIEARRI